MGAMSWQELADLPFAAALRPHRGGLGPRGDYDCEHFDKTTFDEASAPGSRFLECAFTGASFTGGDLRQARFASAWLRDVRFTGTTLAETEWTDAALLASAWAGTEAFGARLHRVTLHGCKLDSVNFRGAELTEVVFDNCVLRDVDFTGAPARCGAGHHHGRDLAARRDRHARAAHGDGAGARREPGHRRRGLIIARVVDSFVTLPRMCQLASFVP